MTVLHRSCLTTECVLSVDCAAVVNLEGIDDASLKFAVAVVFLLTPTEVVFSYPHRGKFTEVNIEYIICHMNFYFVHIFLIFLDFPYFLYSYYKVRAKMHVFIRGGGVKNGDPVY